MSLASKKRPRHAWRWLALVGLAVGATLAAVPSALGAGAGMVTQTNLVSDQAGKAELTDHNLVNAWGLAFGPNTPAWVANNGSDNSTLYQGGAGMPVTKLPLTVAIPGGAPTGAVFNDSSDFGLRSGGPALFIFDSEAGRITAWNQSSGTKAKTVARVRHAIFKGLAIAKAKGSEQIYATDFHHGKVDVFDGNFKRVKDPSAFKDPNLPKHYAPFGIEALGNRILVTYAKQDKKAEDDVSGKGHGFVDAYSTSGKMLGRLISRGPLNSPWGIAVAPHSFGMLGGDLLVGNFGNGHINAFDAKSGQLLGSVQNASGATLKIDGLWALQFGNSMIGSPNTLLFTAGPNDESHGLFGELTASH
jgi:uncharacterized protein (TIGR03118 family)